MVRRLSPPKKPVEIWHDGEKLVAEAGEPLAFALIAADHWALARSPKLHRPRGPYCLSGACDGCLARVDGIPNVMTCMKRAVGGEQIETQNVLGSRGTDLLRAADFLFPKGIDHHQLFAGVPIISDVVQSFARRVAGLGQLPDEVANTLPAVQKEANVVVIGGGRSGLTLARQLASAGVTGITLFDDQPHLGGNWGLFAPSEAQAAVAEARALGCSLQPATTVVGLFENAGAGGLPTVLAANERGATLVSTRALVLATGSQDRTVLFGNNDLPGIFSARAALALWRSGISVGPRVLLVDAQELGKAFEQLSGDKLQITHASSAALLSAKGSARVTGASFNDGSPTWRGEAIVIDGPRPSTLNLAVQAGCEVRFSGEGYELLPPPAADAPAHERRGLWVTGSAARQALTEPEQGPSLATRVVQYLAEL
ncbi:MAG: 2Fe-2S iron-sulfur cluster-binding protein [Polyangiaceae bacterium]|nr:2Fe-2S iron-sulfur cluster-binding protein [Polyangiaceae bacterium]